MGNQAVIIAIMFWIKHATNSASLMGLILMVSDIPAILLGPFAGTFADRYSRRRIIILCDTLNGIAVLALAGMLYWQPNATKLILIAIFVVSAVSSVIGAFFRPAISAAIPDLVPNDKLAAANSMNQTSLQLSTFVGQGAGGVLYRVLGAPLLILIDGITYLFSALSESFITIPQHIPEKPKNRREIWRNMKDDLKMGFRYVWRNLGLRHLFVMAGIINFFFSPFMVLLPFYVEDQLHTTTDWFGYILAAVGLGSLVGFAIAGAIKISGRVRSRLLIAAIILLGLVFAVMGVWQSPIEAVATMFFMGILSGFINISIMTILQITTPSTIRGRVFGFLNTLSMGLAPLGMGLSGIVADWLNHKIGLIFGICGAIILLVVILVSFQPEFRKFLAFEKPTEAAP